MTCLYFDQEQDLIVSGSLDYDIRFWQLSTGQCCQKIDWISKEGHRGVIRTLQADSWRVVSGADDKTIKVRPRTVPRPNEKKTRSPLFSGLGYSNRCSIMYIKKPYGWCDMSFVQ